MMACKKMLRGGKRRKVFLTSMILFCLLGNGEVCFPSFAKKLKKIQTDMQ